MHSIEFKEIEKRYWIPENMGECDKRQYLDMSKLILIFQLGEISYEQFRILGFYALMNMEYSENQLENVQEEKFQNIYLCAELLDSFFETDEDGKKHLIQDYIHNPVKTVKYKLRTFTGPKDAFENITWKQLVEGIGELQSFIESGKIESLVKLFALFYLLKNEKLAQIDLEKRVKYFEHLDIRYVYGFYLLFVSFWRFLATQSEIMVDGRRIDLSMLFNQKKEDDEEEVLPELTELGLRSTAFQLAESGVFGTMQELEETNAWTVLLRLYDMMVRNRKREAEMEKQKNKDDNN